MIDLDKPLADFRLNQLRNQVLALENLMNQLDCSNQADIPLLSLMRIEHMKRMGELLQKVALG